LKNSIFLRVLDNLIEKIILKKPFKSSHKMYKLINRAKGYGVFNITLGEDSGLVGVSLMNSNLKPHKIIILNIDKGNLFIGFPKRDYILENGDNILLYGKVEEVKRAFHLK
jgi:Trk K+ transport system NAD-binding subunit